jgi:hypothetical protein
MILVSFQTVVLKKRQFIVYDGNRRVGDFKYLKMKKISLKEQKL